VAAELDTLGTAEAEAVEATLVAVAVVMMGNNAQAEEAALS
jgi:hypothetical protein